MQNIPFIQELTQLILLSKFINAEIGREKTIVTLNEHP